MSEVSPAPGWNSHSVLLGYQPVWGLAALLLFLLPTTVMMHDFWAIEDPQQRSTQQIQFAKNVALIGAALMMMLARPWPMSLG